MPELVEVEHFRRLLLFSLKSSTTNKNINCCLTVEAPSTTKPNIFPSELELDKIRKCKVKDVERKGKLLRLVLQQENNKDDDSLYYLYLHMGMTGRISTPDHIPSLESLSSENLSFPPPHTHLLLSAGDDVDKRVSYSDPRRFGKVSFGDGPLSSQWQEFAPDALLLLHDKSLLDKLVENQKGIKSLLLDQRAVISGVGNWIADEVLYQSQIHPDQNYLSSKEINRLGECLSFVLKTGIECLEKKSPFPDSWVFHRRWQKARKGSGDGEIKDANGKKIQFLKSGGRTSAIVPTIQKKSSRKSTTLNKSSRSSIKRNKDDSFQKNKRRKSY